MGEALEYNKVLLEHQNAVFQQWAFLTRLEFETSLAFNRTAVVLVSGALIASFSLQQHIGQLARAWLVASWVLFLADLLCLVVALLLSQNFQRATRGHFLEVYGSAAAPDPPDDRAVADLRNRVNRQARCMDWLNVLSVVLLFLGLGCFALFTYRNWEAPANGTSHASGYQAPTAQKLLSGHPTSDSLTSSAPASDTTSAATQPSSAPAGPTTPQGSAPRSSTGGVIGGP